MQDASGRRKVGHMAAAETLVHAVKTKQVVERVRGKTAGAFGYESREARQQRDREADKLDEVERQELMTAWSGGGYSVFSVRSHQGALEDHMLRSPPRVLAEYERAVLYALRNKGSDGAPRASLVEVLAQENVQDPWGRVMTLGASRHEARLTLRAMAGAGRVEFFIKDLKRRKPCVCRRVMYQHQGMGPDASVPAKDCVCGSGVEETIPTEMVRLLTTKGAAVPDEVPREERWAREDRELESFCQMLSPHETRGHEAPAHHSVGASESTTADLARWALHRLSPEHRRVIERAYSVFSAPQLSGLSVQAARLAVFCPTVENARKELVEQMGAARGLDREGMKTLSRSIFAADALRAKLDAQPPDEEARKRWKAEREVFIKDVESDAASALRAAVAAYRLARGPV